jgi:hypothetical protein
VKIFPAEVIVGLVYFDPIVTTPVIDILACGVKAIVGLRTAEIK